MSVSREEVLFYLEDLRFKFDKIEPMEYYLSYSGGRDSHLLYWFIKEYAKIDGIEIVGMNTYMEHPQILKRITDNCDRILVPKLRPKDIKEKYGIPCFSKNQDEKIRRYQNGSRTDALMNQISVDKGKFSLNNTAKTLLLSGDLHKVSGECCTHLKKNPAKAYEKESGKKPILGVRSDEGHMRKSQYTSCFTKSGMFTPIFDLTDEWMDAIYEEFSIETPEIYKYVDRTGCMGCPYSSFSNAVREELKLLPEKRRGFVVDYFRESYEVLGVDLDLSKTDEDFDKERKQSKKEYDASRKAIKKEQDRQRYLKRKLEKEGDMLGRKEN